MLQIKATHSKMNTANKLKIFMNQMHLIIFRLSNAAESR